jgi:hypothetical protein
MQFLVHENSAFAGIGFGLHGVALWPAVVLYSVMTIWCVVSLRRSLLNIQMERNL